MITGFWWIVFIDVRFGAALVGRELAITDEAVRPVVDNFDLQFVVARFKGLGDVHPSRRTPDYSEILSVERHLRRLADISEIEIKPLLLAEN